MLRVMLSSHRLCPRSWSVSVAFTVLLPGRGRSLSLWLLLPGGGHAIAREFRYPVGREAELGDQLLQRCRGPEGVHPDHGAAVADVVVPAQGRRLFDRDACLDRGREHLVAVGLGLAV